MKNSQQTILSVVVVGIIIIIGLFIFGTFASDVFSSDAVNTSTQTILTSATDTMTPIYDGITSSNANANNQTWLEFDGDGDYVQSVNNIGINAYPFTISGWVNTTDISKKQYAVELYNTTNAYYGFGFQNSNFFYSCRNTTVANTKEVNSIEANNEWFYLTTVYHNDGLREFYVNGVSLDTDNRNCTFYGDGKLNIAEFDGSIDNILVFNRNLTDYQIFNNYYNGQEGIYFNKKNNFSTLSEHMQKFWINGSDSIYAFYNIPDKGVFKSVNDGATWVRILNITGVGTGTRNIFVDSRNTIFLGVNGNESLFMSYGNDTNWTQPLTFVCGSDITINGTAWGMTEDNLGNIFVGEYTSGDGNEQCGYIHKSSDGGLSWTISLNATLTFGDGRHIHNVKYDNYTGNIYASIGDDTAGIGYADRNRIIRSIDNGVSWENLSDDIRDNIIAIEFTPNYRLFGEDKSSSTPTSGIIRTSDDITFETVFTLPNGYIGDFYSSSKDNSGNIYFSVFATIGNRSSVWMSEDEGDSWNLIYATEILTSTGGISQLSNFNSNDYFFFDDAKLNKAIKMNVIEDLPKISYQFNENSGTTAHDLSGNGNDGTISGATWNTDGLFVLLTEGVDYSLSTTTGLFTILNTDLQWSEMIASWTYDYQERQDGYDSVNTLITGLGGSSSWLAIIIVVLFATIVIGILTNNLSPNKEISSRYDY